jgi:hemerythrin-like domain-containing protein
MDAPGQQPGSAPSHSASALRPLAQDHAAGFAHARALGAASTADQRRAALASFVQAWKDRLAPHFDDEERLLLPIIEHCDGRRRLLAEHEELRRMAAAAMLVGPDPDPAWVARLGQLLHDHLFWEDHELFPCIEKSLSEPERQRLAEAARKLEQRRATE